MTVKHSLYAVEVETEDQAIQKAIDEGYAYSENEWEIEEEAEVIDGPDEEEQDGESNSGNAPGRSAGHE
jgi:hypothetical protein